MGGASPVGRASAHDDGFTLIEVLVALVLLGIVATAGLYFFVEGTRTSSHLQRTQNAVAVANEAMERAYGIDPKNNGATGVSGLVIGRAQADVTAAWSSASTLGVASVANMYPLWDPGATTSGGAIVPLTYSRTYSGQEYDVTTLVGACYRSASVTATDQDCTRVAGYASEPSTPPGDTVRMLRITTVVTWDPVADECDAALCSYSLDALADQSSDLKWNQVINPVAVDDSEVFQVNDPARDIVVLTNDVVGPLGSSPVQIISGPTGGTVATPTTQGVVRYTPPANASGIFTFVYRLKDAKGAQDDGTVTVTIPPQATADTARVLSGQGNPLAVTANDLGSKQSVTVTQAPTKGTVTVSGTTVTYTPGPGVTGGGDSFKYTYTDPSGQVSPEVPVSLLIDSLTVQDQLIAVPYRTTSAEAWTDLTGPLLGTNTDPSTLRITVSGAKPAAGTLQVAGTTYNGTALVGASARISPPRNAIGEWTVQYQLSRDGGPTTTPRNVVLRVLPVATNDTISTSLSRGGTRDIAVGGNDLPTTFTTTTNVDLVPGTISPGCGSWPSNQQKLSSGVLQVTVPNTTVSGCTLTYQLKGRGTLAGLVSQTATVTYGFK